MSTSREYTCPGCDGTGNLSIHDVEGWCGMCDGTGRCYAPDDARKWFLVVSGEYNYVEPILEDGSGPMYDEHDVMWVRTRTAKRAKVLMVRAYRRRHAEKRSWHESPWLTDGNPFRGMHAIRGDKLPSEELPVPA